MERTWARLYAAVALPQHGVVAAWQAQEHGLSRRTFYEHVRRYGWEPLLPGVWAMPATRGGYEQQAWAALVATGLRGLLTAESTMWALGALPYQPGRVAVLLPPDHHLARRPRMRFHRGRWLSTDVVDRRRGLPTVPPRRAFTDYAADHAVEQIVKAASALHRKRVAGPDELRAYVGRRGRFPGRGKALRALETVGGELSHSDEEAKARRYLRAAALPLGPWPTPFTIVHRGRWLAEVDIAWPEVRYGAEVDGPHHDLPEVAAADKARDRRLSALGWVIDRFPYEEIATDPDAFVAQVRRGLQAAVARGAQPWEPTGQRAT